MSHEPIVRPELADPDRDPESGEPFRSWKVEVNTAGDPPDSWPSNGLRFETNAEAYAYGLNLTLRWTAVRDWRVRPATEEPNQ